MLDERTGLTHDYTCKSGVAEAVILTPATAPASVVRTVPNSGMPLRRPNAGRTSQLAREIELAIPANCRSDAVRKPFSLLSEKTLSVRAVADVAFHHMDKTNPHVHIMLTGGTRAGWDLQRFGAKGQGLERPDNAETWRASWGDHATEHWRTPGYQEADRPSIMRGTGA